MINKFAYPIDEFLMCQRRRFATAFVFAAWMIALTTPLVGQVKKPTPKITPKHQELRDRQEEIRKQILERVKTKELQKNAPKALKQLQEKLQQEAMKRNAQNQRLKAKVEAQQAMQKALLQMQANRAQVRQFAPVRVNVQPAFGMAAGMPNGANLNEDGLTEIDLESGAILKTDPELEGTLEKAERFRADGNYRVACQLWQIVLQQSGDTLYSSDKENYFSLVEQVETILASLPPEGLEAYRVLADAEAKEIMAQATSKTDELALSKVVRQFFISSLGDEAAFDLGCIYLDRFEFIGARRMFEKIVRQYPDPSISLDQVYSRIALCQSFLGDVESAEQTLLLADEFKPNTEAADLVRRSLGELTPRENNSSLDADWVMPMGDSQRYGTTNGVPKSMMSGDLKAVWQYYYDPRDKYNNASDTKGKMLSGAKASGEDVAVTRTSLEQRMIKGWRSKVWRPAGQLLLQGNRIYFKTGSDLSVWNRSAINELATVDATHTIVDDVIQWRSLWSSAFQVDDATKMRQIIKKSYGAFNRRGGRSQTVSISEPSTASEIQSFGDGIYQQMSIYKGTLFNIEGTRFSMIGRNVAQVKRITPQWNTSYRRSRSNRLTAYDAVSGKVRWSLPRDLPESGDNDGGLLQEEKEAEWISAGGFMSAPVGYGDLVIVPVNMGGAISVYALDPAQEGKTIWKSFLCDEPESGAVAWSAIDLSIDGSDLFVNCGMGVVFVLDPSTGLVRFAKRYKRVGKEDEFQRRNNWTTNRLDFEGWSSDLVIPYGRQMVCLSSDTNRIQSFDRNTGELLWHNNMNPVGYKVDYLLGVYDDYLYAAGPETIIAFDLAGDGRMVWGSEQVFEDKQSFGRGMLTPQGIYMPVGDGIYHFDLKGKDEFAKLIDKVHVDLGTEAPVGNLYSDGERFWVHGGNRLYALGPVEN